MRRLALLTLFTIAVAVPLHADRGQSYFTYDDGGTILRQAEDNRDLDVRINLPVFPGDEVITGRRGRSEIRLSDGNVIALDRATDVRFRSILDSYEGNAAQTVIELRYGHIVVQRTDSGQDFVRLDSDNASYVASDEAIYAVDSDRGRDRLIVFDGTVEVRTPQRTSRVRAGEEANVDQDGLYGLVRQTYSTADDFERWYLKRAERYSHGSSRYLDHSLAYADAELSSYGSWTYVSGLGTWGWRPRVAIGWRPFFYGEWVLGLGGNLIWTSYEPWGWVPYHYGRWAYDALYGWVWLPGTGYSPAWVYWMYGPGYIGWAPAGWWDCYRPYYDWAYRPYYGHDGGHYWNVGGPVRPGDIDYRPWTFLNSHQFVGQRVDRGAVPIDVVRERLRRTDIGGLVVSSNPARFSRGDMKDSASAVNNIIHRGNMGGSGDVTPFIRRDAEIPKTVRDRIVRSAPAEPGRGLAPIGGGGLSPIGGGSLSPIGSGGLSPIVGNETRTGRGDSGQGRTVDRGTSGATPSTGGGIVRRGAPVEPGTVNRGSDRGSTDRGAAPGWRDSGREGGVVRRGEGSAPRGGSSAPAAAPSTPTTPAPATAPAPSWRERVQRPEASPAPSRQESSAPPADREWRGRPARGEAPRPAEAPARGSDVPRTVIDRIGGARVYPSDGGRASAPPPRESAPPRVERSSPPPSSPPPAPAHSSPPPQKDNSSSGRVHRNQ